MEQALLDAAFDGAAGLPPDWYSLAPGEQLRAVREGIGVSQRCLAEQSGVPQSVISRCERGLDVRVSTLFRLFACLGCRVTLAVMMGCEEAEDLAAEEREQRKDRQLEGLAVRWYRQRGR